jgi:hypothetical protein
LNLQTKQQIWRSQWQKMVTTKLVIEQINAYDPEAAPPPTEAVQPTTVDATEVANAQADNLPDAAEVVASPEGQEVVAIEKLDDEKEEENVPELEAQGDDDNSPQLPYFYCGEATCKW